MFGWLFSHNDDVASTVVMHALDIVNDVTSPASHLDHVSMLRCASKIAIRPEIVPDVLRVFDQQAGV
jgi:hypothetical protein